MADWLQAYSKSPSCQVARNKQGLASASELIASFAEDDAPHPTDWTLSGSKRQIDSQATQCRMGHWFWEVLKKFPGFVSKSCHHVELL